MLNKFLACACFGAMLSASPVLAATYDFNMTFDGSAIALDSGSDVPDGTVLEVGDSFTLTLSAVYGDFWRANAAFDAYFPLSFLVPDSATRVADIATEFFRDGSSVGSTVEDDVGQSYVHVGAQQFHLLTGFSFDTVVLNWVFESIDDPFAQTIISASGPNLFESFSDPNIPFFRSPDIEYVSAATVVPLPAAGWLMLAGLGGLAALRRRRKAA